MKAIYKYLDTRLFLIGLLVLPFLAVVSCQNDNDDAIPVIHYIRVTDPVKADSTFTDVNPGTMIVVVGEHLSGTQKVYVNDQEVSFNSNYVTSTSIILTVPKELELTGENPELKGEIRVETDHGIATYNMHVLSPAPYITRISATYPINPGDEMTVIGGNFYEVQAVYLSTEQPAKDGTRPTTVQEISDYEVNRSYSQITLTAPTSLLEEGYLVVECYTSSAVTEFKKNGPKPVVTAVSSTMPVVGSTVTITGQNLIEVSRVNINDEFDIPVEDITTSDTFDEISFILPQAPTQSGHISVTALGGTVETIEIFYPVENVILNYDGIGSHVWGDCSFVVADGSSAPYVSTGTCLGITGTVSASNYWWKQSYSNAQWVNTNVIPGNTPIGDLKLQFECFVKEVFTGPVFQIAMCENFDAALSGYVPVSSFTRKTETGKWMQCSVPLSSVVADATYQEFLNRNSAHIGVYATNPGGSEATIEVYFDNFRIVRK